MLNFCTYFDLNYLHRGLALYRSILRHSKGPFKLWVLCLDEATKEILRKLRLPGIEIISAIDFEKGDEPLRQAKKNRSKVEYYWTSTPSLALYIFHLNPQVQILIYLDADIYFFSSSEIIVDELGDKSILINLQNCNAEYKISGASGKYNVGVMAFRPDKNGITCLNWWRKQCIKSCRYNPKEEEYGDQHYLNDWPERFENVAVSDQVGLRAAPWNASKYVFNLNQNGQVMINDSPLACYHFHGLYFCTHRLIFLAGWNHRLPLAPIIKKYIYIPYVKELLAIEKELIEKKFSAPLPKKNIPWRYIGGRLLKLEPLHAFLWVAAAKDKL